MTSALLSAPTLTAAHRRVFSSLFGVFYPGASSILSGELGFHHAAGLQWHLIGDSLLRPGLSGMGDKPIYECR